MQDRRSKHRPSCLVLRGKSNLERAPIAVFFFLFMVKLIFFFFSSQASDGRSSRWNFPRLPRNLHSYLAWNPVILIKQNKTNTKQQNTTSSCRRRCAGMKEVLITFFKLIKKKKSYRNGNKYKTALLLTRSERFIYHLSKTATGSKSCSWPFAKPRPLTLNAQHQQLTEPLAVSR